MHPTNPPMGGQAHIDPPPSSPSYLFFSFFLLLFHPTKAFGNQYKIKETAEKKSWLWNVRDWTFTSKGTSETARDRYTTHKNFEAWAFWMWSSKLRWSVRGRMLAAQIVDKRSKTLQMNGTNKCSAVNTTWHLYREAKPCSRWWFLTILWTKGSEGFSPGCSDRSMMTGNTALVTPPVSFSCSSDWSLNNPPRTTV